MPLSQVRKRDGRIVSFEREKIEQAVGAAMRDVKYHDESKQVTNDVISFLLKHFKKVIPTVEDIQDVVEDVLIQQNMHDVAKAYILYRAKREELRDLKFSFGVKDDMKLSLNAITVLQKRYLQRDAFGKIIETPEQMFCRIAKHVASAEKKQNQKKLEDTFFHMIKDLDFMPNTPCIVNAGTRLNQLFACFVLDVPDSIDGIFDTLKNSALIFQTGGGVGYSFSKLRHSGSLVASTNRTASGPVSFMNIFDKGADVIKQGGVRRGALMGVVRVDHPDIFEFITEKAKGGLTNFNVSVAATDDFMHAVINNKDYWLQDHTGNNVQKANAREVFDFICGNAWECGDPGMLFIDEINRTHPMKKLGKIEATNPCGEEPLLSNEACCLGSINLSHMVRNRTVDWPKLAKTVSLSVRFLDNMVTLNNYPTKDIEALCLGNRKVGLGIMGWADMLVAMGVSYNSLEALKLAKEVVRFIRKHAEETSEKLAHEKGIFPNFKKSVLKKKRRNATILTIAPTGSISIIAGCSSGIEPLFGVAYVRNVLSGMQLFEVNEQFEKIARYRGFYSKELMMKIAQQGSIQDIKEIPKDIRDIFVTSLDIPFEWHVRMQAVFQSEVDNAVSKTINLPTDATIGDVKLAYMLAWKLKCKGTTIYRYGSKSEQVLYLGEHLKKAKLGEKHTKVDLEYSGGDICRTCIY